MVAARLGMGVRGVGVVRSEAVRGLRGSGVVTRAVRARLCTSSLVHGMPDRGCGGAASSCCAARVSRE